MPYRNVTKAVANMLNLDPKGVDAILKGVMQLVEDDPAVAEQLFPGKRLVDKPLSRRETIKRASEAAGKRSKSDAADRHAQVLPIICRMKKRNPDVSLADIKKALDRSGVKPPRAKSWSRSTILTIIKKAMENDKTDES